VLWRLKSADPELLVLNVNGEADFINAVRQARAIGIKCPLTGFYLPASEATIKALGPMIEGMEFINLPLLENTLSPEGKRVFEEFNRRFGAPQSIQLGVALTVETLRLLDLALSSDMPPEQYLRSKTHDTLIGPISFDETGEVRGIPFQIQKIENGKVVILEKQ
jgi:ABC-type branched-subunit amino acid transport system substrate-binding protein